MNKIPTTIILASLFGLAGPSSSWAAENSVDWLNRTERENRAKRSAPAPAAGKQMTAPSNRFLPSGAGSRGRR
jgi:hypothetical protein